MLNRLFKYERQCLSEMFNELYSNAGIIKPLNEGHTLLNHIDKLINVYENRIKFSPAKEPYVTYKLENQNNALKDRIY